jgi:hypothetical protein
MALTGSSCRAHLWPYALMHYRGFPVPRFQSLGVFYWPGRNRLRDCVDRVGILIRKSFVSSSIPFVKLE